MQRYPFDLKLHDFYQEKARQRLKQDSQFLLNYALDQALDRFDLVKRKFSNGVDYFGYSGLWGHAFQKKFGVQTMTHLHNNPLFAHKELNFCYSEREENPFFALNRKNRGKEIDLFLCPLNLHFINDLPKFLREIRENLKKDGLFFACVAGAGTLRELRLAMLYAEEQLYNKAHIRISPFLDIKEAGSLLQYAGFSLPVVEKQDITLYYNNIYDLIKDLRRMGMQNNLYHRSKTPVSRRFLPW